MAHLQQAEARHILSRLKLAKVRFIIAIALIELGPAVALSVAPTFVTPGFLV